MSGIYSIPREQTALVQAKPAQPGSLPFVVSHTVPVNITLPLHHVLVRVLAVALNPTDHKMPTHFPMPGSTAGCDFSGIVVAGEGLKLGTRVCGNIFAYNPALPGEGSFAQYVVADCRQLLCVPDTWSDLDAAALGGVGWKTAALALWDPEFLGLKGRPSNPIQDSVPVLVYGGATATGTMACQLLKLSGYTPIAVASPASSRLVIEFGAAGTASYLSSNIVQDIQAAARAPIKHVLDCVTDAESVATSFAALARSGGRYTCLEAFNEQWRSRRTVRTSVVMAYETTGVGVDLGTASPYTRAASTERHQLGIAAAAELQQLLSSGTLRHHPAKEVQGGWDGILKGLEMLQRGKVAREKLVVRIA